MAVTRHLYIPDTQVAPGVRITHIRALGNYIAAKRPEVIIIGGDWYDMKSLCIYDRDLAEVTQRRYAGDLKAGNEALDALMECWPKSYKPRMEFTEGNHEVRAKRLVEMQPTLQGAIEMPGDYAKSRGWTYRPFMEPIVINGIAYCHLFARSANGRVVNTKFGAANARTQVLREMRSCTAGHKPGIEIHVQPTANGALYGIIAGSFYQHEEEYMTPQGTTYWRGAIMKHEVRHGQYDIMPLSINYLLRRWL